jgi:hypothetical protein
VVFFTLNSRVSTSSALDGLKQGFRNLGYVEGRSITLEERFGEGRREVLAGLAREIVGGPPRAIVTLAKPGGNLTGFSLVGPEAGREESGVSQGRVPRDQERRSARPGRA